MYGRKFTEDEDNFLRANYLTIPAKRMAKMLGRSEGGARQRMKVLGITVPSDIVERFKKDSQIKPGNISHNKGKKQTDFMSLEAINRTSKTRFKKGNLPHNTRDRNGEISVRKDKKTGINYLYIRVDIAKWVLYQRYQYEKFIGEIPTGYVIALKDSNPANCCPTNLELISQSDNMLRNTIHRYPKEIITTIKALSKLKKTIKNYGKKQIS